MRRPGLSLLLFIPAAAAIGLIWWTEVPLGVPGEWTWARAAPSPPVVVTFAQVLLAGIGYLWFVWFGANRIERSRPISRAAWLVGLVLAGIGWLWTAQEAAPEGLQLSKAAWVLYFPGPSGYFTEARKDARPVDEFLGDYEQRMSEGEVLHIGTHPPGLIVVFRFLLALCREFPALTDVLVASEPDSVRRSFDALVETAPAGTTALDRVDRAVLWLAAFLAQSTAALTVVPLFLLLRRTCSVRASWLAASLWPTVPAVAVFLPKSDAFFPCLTALILWLWLTGVEQGRKTRCALAGFVLWLALCLSLAFLPVALLAVIVSLTSFVFAPSQKGTRFGHGFGRLSSSIASIGVGFALPIVVLRLVAGINLLVVWWLNLRNHAGFYRQFTRTYWKWFLVNPIEFALAAGLPLVCLAIYAVVREWRKQDWLDRGPAVAFAITWGILWLSGKNMGEAARLWIFLTPCLIWLAAPLLDDDLTSAPERVGMKTPFPALWTAALTSQLITCGAIVTRVAGFQFP